MEYEPDKTSIERHAMELCAIHCEATIYGVGWVNLSSVVRDVYRFEAKRNLIERNRREAPLLEALNKVRNRMLSMLACKQGGRQVDDPAMWCDEALAAHDRLGAVQKPTLAEAVERMVNGRHMCSGEPRTSVRVEDFNALLAALSRERSK